MEHRLVMEKQIGRYLTKEEIVHHVDLNKTSNDINNLCLYESNSAHRFAHAQLEKIATELIRAGVIKFDDGTYFVDRSTLKESE